MTITFKNPSLLSLLQPQQAMQCYSTHDLSPRWPYTFNIKTMAKSTKVPIAEEDSHLVGRWRMFKNRVLTIRWCLTCYRSGL